tara:strand:- start:292 stop:621 length:330 start_codon:yes stop_codon:yes gene_type:complete
MHLTTDQGLALKIKIKKAEPQKPHNKPGLEEADRIMQQVQEEWDAQGINQHVIEFRYLKGGLLSSYYTDTLLEHDPDTGLCLDGNRWEYQSIDKDKFKAVIKYIESKIE